MKIVVLKTKLEATVEATVEATAIAAAEAEVEAKALSANPTRNLYGKPSRILLHTLQVIPYLKTKTNPCSAT